MNNTLRHRVIPVVLLDGFSVVKTIGFDVRRNLGNPITVARIYNTRNVDELILLDIDASKQNRSIDLFTIRDVATECFMPLTVGGGIHSITQIKQVLENGADKISINSFALSNPEFIREASSIFGSQCIVVSVDVIAQDGKFTIYSHSNQNINYDLAEWCGLIEKLGAGELLLNVVNLDGKMCGYDLSLIEFVAKCVTIPIVFCGGASVPFDFVKAIRGGASAVAASSIFHFTDYTPNDCKETMQKNGIAVRYPL